MADSRDAFFEPTSPGDIDDTFARWLRLSQQELLETADQPNTIPQTGGAYLPGAFPLAALRLAQPITESIIETFVVEGNGKCTTTGTTDQALTDQWTPLVETMANAAIAALAKFHVVVEWPAYLTASLTPLDQVTATPHFDNDHFMPSAGVDVVAIAADHGGTRLALEPIRGGQLVPGLPVELEPESTGRFLTGAMATQLATPHRIVVFPQFGQLHGGPILGAGPAEDPLGSASGEMIWGSGKQPEPIKQASCDAGSRPVPVRNLLVFRATSRPG